MFLEASPKFRAQQQKEGLSTKPDSHERPEEKEGGVGGSAPVPSC